MSNAHHVPKRTALLAVAAVSTAMLGGAPAAVAQPESGEASQAAQKLRELSRQAEVLTEDYKKAQDDHEAKRRDLDRFNAEAQQADKVAAGAHAQEEQLRGRVDRLSEASYKGARMNSIGAVLDSETPDAFLDRAAALDLMAQHNNEAVHAFADATHRAESAQQQAHAARAGAERAEADAARLEGDIANRKKDMDAQVAKVKEQYEELSEKDKDALSGVTSAVGQLAGSGAAIKAVNAALSKQGSPYVFGAKGPSEFDCSGLVQWAYKQAGVDLPSSTRSQVSAGRSVSQSEMKPGDIVFFYSSASHDGIYIGNGKIVHAPTEGQDVTVEEVEYMGEVHSVRRVAG
ncbi:NlpC/P60 family protein [Saccharopolyspora flava]|uniref:Cell wall-associated hydrolase, NlpC family n=1 Tax=Saccharopolyspora flava TaxID=95161 RepID=A0A1I6S7Q9_9PSEU|nr:C40 family peptidase [Saccharopolyspora flava]SFS72808.1 Cell wall-associated hydrolase, NlpC family [Saccharopolyspora flava]